MNKNINLYHRLFGKLANELTENGIMVYISLKALYNQNMEDQWLTLNAINRVLKPESKLTNHSQKQDLIEGIKELEKHEYIKIIEVAGTEYHLDMSGLFVKKEETVEEEVENTFDEGTHLGNHTYTNYFTKIELEYLINTYVKNNFNKAIFKYLFFYLGKKAFNPNNRDGKECYFFQGDRESLADEAGIDVRTLDKYNELLMENKIIYVIKYDYKWNSSDGYSKQVNNIYGLYKDKDKLEEEKDKFLEEHKAEIYYSPIPVKGIKKEEDSKESKKESLTNIKQPNANGGFEGIGSISYHSKANEEASISKRTEESLDSDSKEMTDTTDSIPKETVSSSQRTKSKNVEPINGNIYDWKKSLAPLLDDHGMKIQRIDGIEIEANLSEIKEYEEINFSELV